jgi:hypothetical protein
MKSRAEYRLDKLESILPDKPMLYSEYIQNESIMKLNEIFGNPNPKEAYKEYKKDYLNRLKNPETDEQVGKRLTALFNAKYRKSTGGPGVNQKGSGHNLQDIN